MRLILATKFVVKEKLFHIGEENVEKSPLRADTRLFPHMETTTAAATREGMKGGSGGEEAGLKASRRRTKK